MFFFLLKLIVLRKKEPRNGQNAIMILCNVCIWLRATIKNSFLSSFWLDTGVTVM